MNIALLKKTYWTWNVFDKETKALFNDSSNRLFRAFIYTPKIVVVFFGGEFKSNSLFKNAIENKHIRIVQHSNNTIGDSNIISLV